jgi:hypothetical protein
VTTKTTPRYVVVTTEHRGVFFGALNGSNDTDKTVSLNDAQMCVYWTADVRGVLGLASSGPSQSCRMVDSGTLRAGGTPGRQDRQLEAQDCVRTERR